MRALHFYDQLGLLKPRRRAPNGYRLYDNGDLARLEQIIVLKFLGLPLKKIHDFLRDESSLTEQLECQHKALAEKRRQLDQTIQAIQAAKQSLAPDREPDWNLFKQIIKEVEMQNDTDWTQKYYSADAKKKIEARKTLWSPELQAQVSQQWTELFADIEAALGEDPFSPTAQALAARWKKLVSGFTGGDPEIQKGLNAMYADQQNWPATAQQWRIRPEIQAFVRNAMAGSSGLSD